MLQDDTLNPSFVQSELEEARASLSDLETECDSLGLHLEAAIAQVQLKDLSLQEMESINSHLKKRIDDLEDQVESLMVRQAGSTIAFGQADVSIKALNRISTMQEEILEILRSCSNPALIDTSYTIAQDFALRVAEEEREISTLRTSNRELHREVLELRMRLSELDHRLVMARRSQERIHQYFRDSGGPEKTSSKRKVVADASTPRGGTQTFCACGQVVANREGTFERMHSLFGAFGSRVSCSMGDFVEFLALDDILDDSDGTSSTLSEPSVAEVKEGPKLVEELQAKLDEGISVLAARDSAVDNLERRISDLTAALDTTKAQLNDKQTALNSSEDIRAGLEAELSSTRADLNSLRSEFSVTSDRLHNVDLQFAEVSATLAAERSTRLQVEDNLKSLRADFSDLQVAEHEARANADRKNAELQDMTNRMDALRCDFTSLDHEHQQIAQRAANLYAEVQQNNEKNETLQLQHKQTLSRVASLEGELVRSASKTQEIEEDRRAKEDALRRAHEHISQLADELQQVRVENDERCVELGHLSSQLAAVKDSHARERAEGEAVLKEHRRRLEEGEKVHNARHGQLSEEINRVLEELKVSSLGDVRTGEVTEGTVWQAQEDQYHLDTDTLHATHRDEVATLQSQIAELEQLHDEDRSAIRELQICVSDSTARVQEAERELADQEAALEEVQVHLADREATVSATTVELEKVRSRLDESRQRTDQIERAKDEVIECLSEELSNARDAHNALKETFLASDHHAKKLEETLQHRDLEITQLRESHQREVAALTAEKAEWHLRFGEDHARIHELHGELHRMKDRAAGMEKQLSDQKHALKSTEDALAESKAALALASQEILSKNVQLDEARRHAAQTEKMRNLEISQLKKDLSESNETRANLNKNLDVAKETLSKRHAVEIEEGIRKRSDELHQLRAQHQSAVEELYTKHRAALKQQVTSSLHEIDKRDKELNALRGELTDAKEALRAANEQVQSVKSQFDKLCHSAEALEKTKDGIIAQLRTTHEEQHHALHAQKEELRNLHIAHIRELQLKHQSEFNALKRKVGATGLLGGMAGAVLAGIVYLA
ncbi:uncharacterized protein FIBRA_06281 [Fibroporia radiculosa]|uniref:Uncharacterized protein n=1 Tax=Fibroporia radiculosa TaxID=599839 RepID=J4GSG7_9APHY|nr:uncharacterized protein FIBRA_06281 [Fibroporia radiculosa]CCM04120.1 predicted protein [Fibroporia radiculosa]